MSEVGAKKDAALAVGAKKDAALTMGKKKDAALADRVLRLNLNPVA